MGHFSSWTSRSLTAISKSKNRVDQEGVILVINQSIFVLFFTSYFNISWFGLLYFKISLSFSEMSQNVDVNVSKNIYAGNICFRIKLQMMTKKSRENHIKKVFIACFQMHQLIFDS